MLTVGMVKRLPQSFYVVLLSFIHGSVEGCGILHLNVFLKCQIEALGCSVSHIVFAQLMSVVSTACVKEQSVYIPAKKRSHILGPVKDDLRLKASGCLQY
jgi:hypothetical protein